MNMQRLNANLCPAPQRPVRVLQFGEGNFLRAFCDWMIDIANEKAGFDGSIVLVKPISIGTLFPAFREQDYRYTVMLRGLVDGKPDYDLILYVASWPQQRIDAWDSLLKARAIENVCYVAGVNRVGKDPGNLYSGHTSLYGPRGELLSICKEGRIDIIESELKRPVLDQFRQSFPALLDADY
jgi:hypothetical protein